jgi:general stress protein YciG
MEYRTAQQEAHARDVGRHGGEDRGGTVPGDCCGDGSEDPRACDEAAG